MRSLAPIAGFLGFSTMAASALNLSREITNLSKVGNAGFEDFQKRAFAAKTVGVEMEKLADIFKDTGDKIGDFLQTGGGPLVDFFENIAPKVGVTAEMFRHLGGRHLTPLEARPDAPKRRQQAIQFAPSGFQGLL